MLRLDFPNIQELESLHYDAVEDYVKGMGNDSQTDWRISLILQERTMPIG